MSITLFSFFRFLFRKFFVRSVIVFRTFGPMWSSAENILIAIIVHGVSHLLGNINYGENEIPCVATVFFWPFTAFSFMRRFASLIKNVYFYVLLLFWKS